MSSLRERREDWRDLSSASVELASFALRSGDAVRQWQVWRPVRLTVIWIEVVLVKETLVEGTRVLFDLGDVEHDLVSIARCARSETEWNGWHGGYGCLCWRGYLCISERHALLHLVVDGGLSGILPRRGGLCELGHISFDWS